MKLLVGKNVGGYTFDASAQQITLTGLTSVKLEQILMIVNVTDNATIYRPISVGFGGSISGNVITLDYDTTLMSDTDILQIWLDYEDAATEATLGLIKSKTDNLDVALSTVATQTTLSSFSSKSTTDVHVRVHSGVYFHSGHNTTLNNTQTMDLLIVTGSKTAHFFFEVFAFNGNSNKSFTVDFYENTTVSASGTTNTIYNLNRASSTSATTSVYITPTVTTVGTAIMNQRTGLKEFKLVVRPGEEYNLKPNTNFLIRITSLINNNDIQANIGFYEV